MTELSVTGEDTLENGVYTDKQIVQSVLEEYGNFDASLGAEEQDDDESQDEKISHEDRKKALQLAEAFIEQQDEPTAFDVLSIKKRRDFAFKN